MVKNWVYWLWPHWYTVRYFGRKRGLDVYFYDIENKLPLGNATQIRHLSELLNMCDIVSYMCQKHHQPKNMIGHEEIQRMKPGSILINASRGTVVDIPALSQALESKHLSGAAVDVFPTEPGANNDPNDPFVLNLSSLTM